MQLKKVVTPIIYDILRLLVLVKRKIFFKFSVFEFTISRRHVFTARKTEILTGEKQLRNTLYDEHLFDKNKPGYTL